MNKSDITMKKRHIPFAPADVRAAGAVELAMAAARREPS
jgi:hypothetical protein